MNQSSLRERNKKIIEKSTVEARAENVSLMTPNNEWIIISH